MDAVTRTAPAIRSLRPDDLTAVVELDALLTEEAKGPYWKDVFERFLSSARCIGLAAVGDDELEGYLFGEMRAFEFGSEPCGWVFAVAVRPDASRKGIGSALLAEARKRFKALGVRSIRTMVRRTDVPILSFFRRDGFVGGPFVQLELDISDMDQTEDRS